MRLLALTFLFVIGTLRFSFCQSGVKDSLIRFPFMGLSYGIYVPDGDLKDRFGGASMVSLNAYYKTAKNWVFGLSGGLIFGDNVNEEGFLDPISTNNGQIIGLDGLYADVRVFERGYMISANFGRIFKFNKPNPNSGIMLTGGTGFIQHKIRIETIGNTVPQLRNDYLKGYDHLTNGLQFNEFIGYVYFSNRQLLNFFGGFEFVQGFTKNRRDYNFDDPTGEIESKNRVDLMYGVKLGWILPLYKKKPAAYYLY